MKLTSFGLLLTSMLLIVGCYTLDDDKVEYKTKKATDTGTVDSPSDSEVDTGTSADAGDVDQPTDEPPPDCDAGDSGCIPRPDTDDALTIDDPIDLSLCGDGPAANAEVIADFERGISMATCENCMGFYTISDGTGTLEPDPSYGAEAPATIMDTCPGSTMAFCIHGRTPFEHWGSGTRMDFNNPSGTKYPRDLTAYRGVGLWAVLLDGPAAVKVGFPDDTTDPAGGTCYDATNLEPSWEAQIGRPSEERMDDCENDWAKTITIRTKNQWKYFEFSFEPGGLNISPMWGKQPDSFHQDKVYGIKIQKDGSPSTYSYCIDDVVLLPK